MYLGFPPPLPSVHVMKEVVCLICIGIMTFWCKYQNWGKFWVSVQGLNTLKNIMKINLISFSSYNNFMVMEMWV